MLTQKDVGDAVNWCDLQPQIEEQRDLCRESDIEVLKCKQALSIAESVSAGRHGRLGELLDLQKRAQRLPMTAEQHNAFPNGRF